MTPNTLFSIKSNHFYRFYYFSLATYHSRRFTGGRWKKSIIFVFFLLKNIPKTYYYTNSVNSCDHQREFGPKSNICDKLLTYIIIIIIILS